MSQNVMHLPCKSNAWDNSDALASIVMAMLDLWYDSEVPMTDALWSFMQVGEVDFHYKLFSIFSSEFQKNFGAFFLLSLGFFPEEKVYIKLVWLLLYIALFIIRSGTIFYQKCHKILVSSL